jgi:hypothetical protein
MALSTPFSLPSTACHSSHRHLHAVVLCHTSFPLSQDEPAAFASSSDNASSCRLLSRAETKALNPYHRRWPPSSDCPIPTLYRYKKVISTLVTLPTTQPYLNFSSSLSRAPCHRSSTCRRRSLSPSSHTYRPSVQ